MPAEDSISISCLPYEFHELGRMPIGVNQHQGGDDYPFVAPSADVRQLLADASLSYRDDYCAYTRPFRLARLWGFGCGPVAEGELAVHTRDVLVEDAEGRTVFDTREAETFETFAWGERLAVCRWTAADIVLALVYYTAWNPDDTPTDFPYVLEPASAVFDERVSVQSPLQLRSIRVGDDGPVLRGSSVILRGGYNAEIAAGSTVQPDGGRVATTVTLTASPGLGLGRYAPQCADADVELVIRRINVLGGDDAGNFLLDADACHRVERPLVEEVAHPTDRLAVVRAASLRLFNDCGPCVDCQDFINVYEACRRLRDRVADLVTRLNGLKDKYLANVIRLLQARQCREDTRLRLILQPECPQKVVIAAAYCNSGDACVHNLVLLVSFDYANAEEGITAETTYEGTPDIVCNSTFRGGNVRPDSFRYPGMARMRLSQEPYVIGGTWPHFWAHFDQIQPGSAGYVTWRLSFPDGTSAHNVAAIADAYALEGPPAPASAASSPVPGYSLGSGPDEEAQQSRLVSAPVYVACGLDDGGGDTDCCTAD